MSNLNKHFEPKNLSDKVVNFKHHVYEKIKKEITKSISINT